MGRGRNKTQSVKDMMEQFMSFHKEGLTIGEIAKRFEISPCRIYGLLQQIADANGVERKELLERVHSPHILTSKPGARDRADFEEVDNIASELLTEIDNLIEQTNI